MSEFIRHPLFRIYGGGAALALIILVTLALFIWPQYAFGERQKTPLEKFESFYTAYLSSSHQSDQNEAQNFPILSDVSDLADIDFVISKLTNIMPASGEEDESRLRFDPAENENTLEVEAVLVPAESVVISSSQDGRIAKINFYNGDLFKKDDVLLEYVCADIKGEKAIIDAEKEFVERKVKTSFKLLKLGLLSELEQKELETEQIQRTQQKMVIEEKTNDCVIKAPFDGRVTNRLANPNEYTRTDRVLMEIAATHSMNTQFVVPSIWLRWINKDAPISVFVKEMDHTYEGEIIRIHGEIDPVSESVQAVAHIDTAGHNVMPGMSGRMTLDIAKIREKNIRGVLEQKVKH